MLNKILLLDKPYKWTSNFTLGKVKKVLNLNKCGYVGTLDPISTGILPILIGNCTKLSKNLSESDKCYDVIAHLGIKTNTYDSEGYILEKKKVNFNKNYLLNSLNNFQGEIKQNSPPYSSVKYMKKHSYEYARLGIKIPNIPRFVTIYNIIFLYFKNNLLKLRITCSKGTYIRSLINDIGFFLKCGAYVKYLRRIRIANFSDKNLVNISNLSKNIYNDFNIYNMK